MKTKKICDIVQQIILSFILLAFMDFSVIKFIGFLVVGLLAVSIMNKVRGFILDIIFEIEQKEEKNNEKI